MTPTLAEQGRRPPVLVVDDDEMCAAVLCDALALLGLPSVIAHSAEEAEGLFRQHRPRAVITDNVMPGKSGQWLASWVRQRSPKTPVIMLSAAPPREAAESCAVRLPKPARISEVRDALARAGLLSPE